NHASNRARVETEDVGKLVKRQERAEGLGGGVDHRIGRGTVAAHLFLSYFDSRESRSGPGWEPVLGRPRVPLHHGLLPQAQVMRTLLDEIAVTSRQAS